MTTFYQYMMAFRDDKPQDNRSRLANWMYDDHHFPKHAEQYDEISRYIETYSPFLNALTTFDEVWEEYRLIHHD